MHTIFPQLYERPRLDDCAICWWHNTCCPMTIQLANEHLHGFVGLLAVTAKVRIMPKLKRKSKLSKKLRTSVRKRTLRDCQNLATPRNNQEAAAAEVSAQTSNEYIWASVEIVSFTYPSRWVVMQHLTIIPQAWGVSEPVSQETLLKTSKRGVSV